MAPNSTRGTAERRSTDRRTNSADFDALAARLDAVERAVTGDGDGVDSPATDTSAPADDDGETTGARVEDADADTAGRDAEMEALRDRVETLEAELDAVRGLLDGVRAVDESVERKADAALAAIERLESPEADGDELVVERVPVDDLSEAADEGTRADRTGTDASDAEEETDSLAARLRGAL
ncbi:DUF7310 family coiled-coil domain-containing protein [Halopelagius longus]|uniref:DUF7310 domain-containing protein n=1 Tax=Halopelagius longus TaxID=1236180 RepID=A0A1H1D9J9_9EURY|nr:hypothetical protein [Halopelagius longus]SDQ73132.1 hypothetical protein SAMN05216278_2299 [Halopelagius longus]